MSIEIGSKCDYCSPYESQIQNNPGSDQGPPTDDDTKVWFIKCPSCDHPAHFTCFFQYFRDGGHCCTKCGFSSLKGGGDWKIIAGIESDRKRSWWNVKNVFGQSSTSVFQQENSEQDKEDCEYCKHHKISRFAKRNSKFLASFIGHKKEDEIVQLHCCYYRYHLNCLKTLCSDGQRCLQCESKIVEGQWTVVKSSISDLTNGNGTKLDPEELSDLSDVCEKIYDPFYCRLCPMYRKPKVVPLEISKNQENMKDCLFPWVKLACSHFFHESCLQLYLMNQRTLCITCNSSIELDKCKPYPRHELKGQSESDEAPKAEAVDDNNSNELLEQQNSSQL